MVSNLLLVTCTREFFYERRGLLELEKRELGDEGILEKGMQDEDY